MLQIIDYFQAYDSVHIHLFIISPMFIKHARLRGRIKTNTWRHLRIVEFAGILVSQLRLVECWMDRDDQLAQFSFNPVWHLKTLLWHRRTNLLSLIHVKMPESFWVQYDHLYSWTFRYLLTSARRLTPTDVYYWSVKHTSLYDYLVTIEITFTCSTLDNCIHNFNKLATKTEIT